MDAVVDSQRGAGDLDETLCLVGSPAGLGLAILAELRLRQVVGRVDADGLEAVGAEFQDGRAGDVAL